MNTKLSLLLEEIEFRNLQNKTKCNVCEQFPLYGKRKYDLNDLTFTEESGSIVFDDTDNILINNTYVSAFMISSVKSVTNDKNTWIIVFKSGSSIKIKFIK